MPIPLIIGGSIILAAFIYNFFSKDAKLRISKKYCIYASPKDSIKVLRTEVCREIDFKIEKSPNFKIGKTGNPDARAADKEYSQYKTMHLICKSTQTAIIDELEAYCIEKYSQQPNNQNIRQGSAGQMNKKQQFFYLYIVVEN